MQAENQIMVKGKESELMEARRELESVKQESKGYKASQEEVSQ